MKIRIIAGFCALSALFLVSGCPSSTQSLDTLGFSISISGGDGQKTPAGDVFASPLKVRVTDANGNPAGNVNVGFEELTTTGSVLSQLSANTDVDGNASTQVQAAHVAAGTPIQILAFVNDTSASVLFHLSTIALGEKLVVTTSPANVTAGVPFSFVIQVTDSSGDVINNATGTLNLNWTFQTTSSWTGIAPTGTGILSTTCTLIQGQCTTAADYIFRDARQSQLFSVTDDSGTYASITEQPVPLQKGPAVQVAFANQIGGPLAAPATGAIAYGSSLVIGATDSAATIAASLVDIAGNYLSDATVNSWTPVGNPAAAVSGFVANGDNQTATFTPGTSGSASLTATDGTLTGNLAIYVDPGPAIGLSVATENSGTEVAGIPFYLAISAVDANGNVAGAHHDGTSPYNSAFNATYNLQLTSPPARKSGGCPRFYNAANSLYDNFAGPDTCTANNFVSASESEIFVNGTMNHLMQIIDPQVNNPEMSSITVNITAPGGGGLLTGHTGPVRLNAGSPDHIMLYNNGNLNSQGYACLFLLAANNAQNNCFTAAVGVAQTFYAVLEDSGGTSLRAIAVNWADAGAWSGQFVPAGDQKSAVFTPTTSGYGSVALSGTDTGFTGNTFTTTYYGKTQ